MKVLITGAGGYVGNLLVQFFAEKDNEVYALYHNKLPIHKNSFTQVHWIQCDLATNIKDIGSVDVIIHAASVHPLSSELPNAVDYLDSNINATRNLLDYSLTCSAKLLIYLSTVTIHGSVLVKELIENTPQHEPNLLGISKFLAERIVENYSDRIPSVILRLPGIVGPELLSLDRPWLCNVLKKAVSNKPIHIFSGSCPFNNVTDIPDIGNLINLLMQEWTSGTDIFNLATRVPLPLKQVVQKIINQTKSDSEIIEQKSNNNSFYINIDKIIDQTKFRPKTTEVIIQDFVEANYTTL